MSAHVLKELFVLDLISQLFQHREMGESLGERRFPWEGPLRVSVVGESILVMGMWCPCKHLFFGLDRKSVV